MSPEKAMTRLEFIEALFSMSTEARSMVEQLNKEIQLGTREEWEALDSVRTASTRLFDAAVWLTSDIDKKAGRG